MQAGQTSMEIKILVVRRRNHSHGWYPKRWLPSPESSLRALHNLEPHVPFAFVLGAAEVYLMLIAVGVHHPHVQSRLVAHLPLVRLLDADANPAIMADASFEGLVSNPVHKAR